MAKVVMVCATCGSDDVVKDATARWDTELQDWSLSGVYDDSHCESCGGECSLKAEALA